MASYHITDDGPRACSTTPDRCPYGRAGGDHFDNVAEAQLSFERTMEEKHGLVGLAQAAKNRQAESYRLYELIDRVQRDSEIYRRIAQAAAYSREAPSKQHAAPAPTGRSRGHERMRRNHTGKRISAIAVRGGRELFTSVGPTPQNLLRLRSYLTREPEKTTN